MSNIKHNYHVIAAAKTRIDKLWSMVSNKEIPTTVFLIYKEDVERYLRREL